MDKLPKFEAWKQSDPDRPGHLPHLRYSSRYSLSEFITHPRNLTELPHSSKLEPRNPVGSRRIPAELLHSSYEEGS
jgi:hypothetical protein